MSDNSKFQRGSGAYTCQDCGKVTRETGSGESQFGLCNACMQVSEIENAIADGYMSEEEGQKAIAKLRK